ncbi:30S ribosomal protein S5 [Candidatus Roizmanbacteria bacterium]|nr:30S ribosomal protein S5 [Candidatus Roizmanbacteria bacterium]
MNDKPEDKKVEKTENGDRTEKTEKMEEKVLLIRRVSKKTTGGNYVTFSALVVVGDGKGQVGIGVGRGLEVPPAIQKAIARAKKQLITVPLDKDSIPHQVTVKFKSARLFLKPAPSGTGLKVGSVARIILDLAGVHNASGKIMGTRNQVVNSYAVIKALQKLKARN